MLFDHTEFDHESVHTFADPTNGLRAIIAIHNRRLGPAIGGCRLKPYRSDSEALTDVLRLSRGMTYKCAIGGIPFGGGKAVVIADPESKTQDLLRAFGHCVDLLGGAYITSFDVGTTLEDIRTISQTTRHVGGIRKGAGDAANSTAQGVFECISAAVEFRWPGRSLATIDVAIQGAGSVGAKLCQRLRASGARVQLADIDLDRADQVARAFGATVVAPQEVLSAPAHVLSPCALGAVFDDKSVPAINAAIIAGGANNQLATPDAGQRLAERGVLYAPDYLVNAGGIIDLHYQINDAPRSELPAHLAGLGQTLRSVFAEAQQTRESTEAVANRIAERRFKTGNSA